MISFKNNLSIIDELKDDKYHSSVIFSYSYDIVFYERYILGALRSSGCKNNIVIADVAQFQSSLYTGYSEDSLIGKYYSLIPQYCKGSFHPKIISLFSGSKIKYLIGSGNLNMGGYSKNVEAFFKIELNIEDISHQALGRAIWSFVRKYAATNKKLFTYKQLTNIEQEYNFLKTNEYLSENTNREEQICFFYHETDRSILDQFLEKIKTKVKRLIVISPFFDKDSTTIKLLCNSLKPDSCDIVLQEDSTSINKLTFPNKPYINFYNLKEAMHHSDLHAKIYVVVSVNGSHILIGSSNCTKSGLGEIGKRSDNVEACIYSFNRMPNHWINELELNKVILDENKIKLVTSAVQFKSSQFKNKSRGTNLISVDFVEGKYIVLCEGKSSDNKDKLVLLNSRFQKIEVLKDCEIGEDYILFHSLGISSEYASLCYIERANNLISNIVAINYQRDLIYNSPKPSLSFLYDIIDEYKNDLANVEFADLLEPIQKLIDHDTNKIFNDSINNSDSTQDEKNFKNEESQRKITYQEFLTKEQAKKNKKQINIYADKTDLGFLIRFLLSRIGVISSEEFLSQDKAINTDTYDKAIYDEEENEEDLRSRPDDFYNFAQKIHIKTAKQTEVRYYRSGIKRLAMKFSEYLGLLNKGNLKDKIAPPKEINMVLVYKYVSVLMLINYFAGREYNVNDEVFEGLIIDDDSYGYWLPTLDIIGRMFCFMDGKNGIPAIYDRTGITPLMIIQNEDIKAMIMLTLFTLSALKYLYRNGETKDVDITFIRMYLNCSISSISFSEKDIYFYFAKYFNDCGYASKRHPLTQNKIINIEDVVKAYYELIELTKDFKDKITGIKNQHAKGAGSFSLPKKINQYVYHPFIGLTIVENIRSSEAVDLYCFGMDALPIGSKYVMPLHKD